VKPADVPDSIVQVALAASRETKAAYAVMSTEEHRMRLALAAALPPYVAWHDKVTGNSDPAWREGYAEQCERFQIGGAMGHPVWVMCGGCLQEKALGTASLAGYMRWADGHQDVCPSTAPKGLAEGPVGGAD
jgi:hypothetical protein